MTEVVLTGATGFVGRTIATAIQQSGFEVTAAGRRRAPGPWRSFVEFDLRDGTPPVLLREPAAVVHAAGIAHDANGDVFSDTHYEQVNALGALTVAKAAADAGARHFVLISSVKAMAETTHGEPLTETAECAPASGYGRSKLRAEHLVADRLRTTTCGLTILRLTPVYGEGSKGNLARLLRWAGRRWFPRLPPGSGGRSMIHVGDVADLTVMVLSQRIGGTMILDDGLVYTPRAIQDKLRARQRAVMPITVPPAVIRGAVDIAIRARAGRRGGGSPSDASRLLDEALYHGAATRDLTGFQPKRSLWTELDQTTV